MLIFILLWLILLGYMFFEPFIDHQPNKQTILWFNNFFKQRKYIILWPLK